MPYIKVNVSKLRNYSSELSSINSRVSQIKNNFSSIASALDWDVKVASNIRSRTNNIVNDLSAEARSLSKMSNHLSSTSSIYANIDKDGSPKGTSNSKPAVEQNVNCLELTEEETDAVITQLAADEGVPKENIIADIKAGLEPAEDWLSKADKYLGKIEKFARSATGATDLVFTFKSGKVILSGFTRSGYLNSLVKIFHKGTGIGTKYLPKTLLNTPVLGKLYGINVVATAVEKVAGVVEGTVKVLSAGAKIVDVLNDDTKTTGEKICDVTAIGATSVIAAALDVSAPFVGTAVTTAVTGLIPIPGVNVVAGVIAGAAVKGIMSTAADVITSEAVVDQYSDSVSNIGNSIISGVEAVSDAGKELWESENFGEAAFNTAKLVGTTVVSYTDVATTALVESTKVVATVAVETVKTVASNVVDAGKSVVNWFKSW